MRSLIIAIALSCFVIQPVTAATSSEAFDNLKPPIEPATVVTVPVKQPGFWDRHPLIFKATYPVREPAKKFYDNCVWIGEKSKPIQPFLNLLGACGSAAGPFVYGFTR